jgi:hypothetical protein
MILEQKDNYNCFVSSIAPKDPLSPNPIPFTPISPKTLSAQISPMILLLFFYPEKKRGKIKFF